MLSQARSQPQRIFVFGSQALSFSNTEFAWIRTALAADKELQWVVQVVDELPSLLYEFAASNPQYEASRPRLYELSKALKNAPDASDVVESFGLTNACLTPLVVIGQLIQYSKIRSSGNVKHSNVCEETLGFCTGLLSAFAVASSRSWQDVATYGAVAIRLAMLVGAVVDVQESPKAAGPSRSLTVAWSNEETRSKAMQIVHSFDGAYVSVWFDENRATVTAPAETASQLQTGIRAAGILASPVTLRGRFHWTGNGSELDALTIFCRGNPRLHFPDASEVIIPTRSNEGGERITSGPLHLKALRSMLIEQPQWYETFNRVVSVDAMDSSHFTVFGYERCLPPSFSHRLHRQITHFSDLEAEARDAKKENEDPRYCRDSDIAIIGMACKVAGANDLEEFWKVLCEGKSQHQEVSPDRVDFDTPFRKIDKSRKWYGNFIDGADEFDHKFFKKSPREASSTDPQQRQLLQIAYQAMEQSGYFRQTYPDTNIGCYIGLCATDYENNVACYEPTAYSAIGNLRGFIAGRVSHYFGWTGPGLTIDTACSASLVAVHQACQAILSGECSSALAGGTHVMTNPRWWENLAGASFLSPTGSCKPFDAKADGYCRGEGVAAVVLKRMSAAIADGDVIYGAIAATAVQQNQNSTPIFVPNSPSLTDLFLRVTARSGLSPDQISVVEAHGTGTAVGDPAEYASVREVLGGSNRSSQLALGSAKGTIGHLECTSGLISLIKSVLMILKEAIPPQGSFNTINPAIGATPADQIHIPTSKKSWKPDFRAVLINNYGASGSNASLVVKQAILPRQRRLKSRNSGKLQLENRSPRLPFWIGGIDERSLKENTAKMYHFLRTHKSTELADVSFAMIQRHNPAHNARLQLTAHSSEDLESQLATHLFNPKGLIVAARSQQRPVIFCFGGQKSIHIGLSRQLYDSVAIFRHHLDACDDACISLGVSSIFPGIFDPSPISDAVSLQTKLFAMQYACAKSWMDSGLQPSALVGHSFGELSALCISGALDLRSALRLIIARATVIRKSWGADSGAMIVVECDGQQANDLARRANETLDSSFCPASIACFNSPRNFTIAGSTEAIKAVSELLSTDQHLSSIRSRQLDITHAFHSALVDPLTEELEQCTDQIQFGKCEIPWERATESAWSGQLTSKFVANHMRQPVYFKHAIERLGKRFPSSIWLEAGSGSTATTFAKRTLGTPSDCHFQAVDLQCHRALDNLTDATVGLWHANVRVDFWAHSPLQTPEYQPLLLPPYQFEKNRHWLATKRAPVRPLDAPTPVVEAEPVGLLTFVSLIEGTSPKAQWKINTDQPAYGALVEGHVVAKTAAICPATVQVDLAIEALRKTLALLKVPNAEPCIQDVKNHAPVTVDPHRSFAIDLEGSQDAADWTFRFKSSNGDQDATSHTTGRLVLHVEANQALARQFAQYERMTSSTHCLEILNSPDADDIVQGRQIYKMFSDVVDYGAPYQGLQKLVGRYNESAGLVVKAYNPATWLDAHLSDAFCQVGGMWVNCMTDCPATEMYIAGGVDYWQRAPNMRLQEDIAGSYHVLARHQRPNDSEYVSDIFVFDGSTGALVEVLLGIQYRRVKKSSIQSFLLKATPNLAQQAKSAPREDLTKVSHVTTKLEMANPQEASRPPKEIPVNAGVPAKAQAQAVRSKKVKAILAELVGLDAGSILDDHDLADLGIDSLMGMEMVRELETGLDCTLDVAEMALVSDFSGLMACVNAALPAVPTSSLNADVTRSHSEALSEMATPDTDIFTPINLATPAVKDVRLYLADFLGLGDDDVTFDHKLIDLGIDSLLSLELKADMHSSLGLHINDHSSLEDMTVGSLNAMLSGTSNSREATIEASSKESYFPGKQQKSRSRLDDIQEADPSPVQHRTLPHHLIQEAFEWMKKSTDDRIAEFGCADLIKTVLPEMDKFCVALILEALDELGCPISSAEPGQYLPYIKCSPEHRSLMRYLYELMQSEAGLIEVAEQSVRRTSTPSPKESSERILHRLLQDCPGYQHPIHLTHYAGSHLAQVLAGKTDGIKLIFGCEKGRRLVSSLYGDDPYNRLFYKQIETFLSRLAHLSGPTAEPLKILEMGAGTAGTTKWLLPMLAQLSIPVEYTFTDLAPSFVMAARKRFGQTYPFVKFRAHDIGKEPDADLIGSQHIVIATNAVHATPDVVLSATHMRKALRPDGMLLMVEMTKPMHWVDLIFGLFEGWWVFNDGRDHAIANETRWKSDLEKAGFASVDWTDGQRPENEYERLIIATVAGPETAIQSPVASESQASEATTAERLAVVEQYVEKMTASFPKPSENPLSTPRALPQTCVLVTGASGSLGSHLVASLALDDSVKSVICLNRVHKGEAIQRQQESLDSKGISLPSHALDKIQALEADMSRPRLGLPEHQYTRLVTSCTHIVHNAWHMNGKATVRKFEPQFDIMSNMTRLASDIASFRGPAFKPSFLFVSSIAVTGHYPLWKGTNSVPEERMSIESVLPNGYGDAKFACELMLDRTLHQHPDRFRTASVRLGQVAGSAKSGYWNPMEHVPMLFKSCRSVNALPNFEGRLSWTPVEHVAGTVADLLFAEQPHPVYHIENPVGQSWQAMLPVLARALSIPPANVIPFSDWIERVRQCPATAPQGNPAKLLIDFIEQDFIRMSCGGLVLDTKLAREHSPTLRAVGPVIDEVAARYAKMWRE